MKKVTLPLFATVVISLLVCSCSRGITTYEAANGKAKCGRYLR